MHNEFIITLLGYTKSTHTNYWPWIAFYRVFQHLGYTTEWYHSLDKIKSIRQKRIYICWGAPDSTQLKSYKEGILVRPGDIIIQKLTSINAVDGDRSINWSDNPIEFYKNFDWPPYKRFESMVDQGVNIYAFGCKTRYDIYPEKRRICEKLKDRIFWIPWGSCLYDWDQLQKAKPIMSGFQYDLGFVGMKWGVEGRGNVDSIFNYLDPLVNNYGFKCALKGKGFTRRHVSERVHKKILQKSQLCPIINAPSWRAEKGIQDRFWTVFSTGRFGVTDTAGVLEFYNENEVVWSEDPQEYVDLSLFYHKHLDKQLPFIEKILKRIKTEYNYFHSWDTIIRTLIKDQK